MHERIDVRSRMAMEEFAKRQWKLSLPGGFSGHSIQELMRIGHKIANSKQFGIFTIFLVKALLWDHATMMLSSGHNIKEHRISWTRFYQKWNQYQWKARLISQLEPVE